MRQVIERGVEIDVCDDCHGVWLDPGELNELSEPGTTEDGSVVNENHTVLDCLRCRTRNFVTVSVDVGSFARCADCAGVFVFGETLDAISKDRHSVSKSKQFVESVGKPLDALHGLLELLGLFA